MLTSVVCDNLDGTPITLDHDSSEADVGKGAFRSSSLDRLIHNLGAKLVDEIPVPGVVHEAVVRGTVLLGTVRLTDNESLLDAHG